jgi:hypothetical protein
VLELRRVARAEGSVSAAQDTAPTITIGSSDIAPILGVHPNRNQGPWYAWTRLVGLAPRYSNDRETGDQTRGKRLEPMLGFWYQAETNIPVQMGPQLAFGQPPVPGPEPWQHSRPDFFACPPMSPFYPLEGKSLRVWECDDRPEYCWGEAGTDAIPRHYLCQSLWHIQVCQAERCDVPAFATIPDEFRIYSVPRREKTLAGLVTYVRNWHEKHVLGGEAPPMDGSTAASQAILSMFPEPKGRTWRNGTAEDGALVRDLERVKRQLADLRVEERRIRNELARSIGDAYGLKVEGVPVATFPAVKATTHTVHRPATRRLALTGENPEGDAP